MKDVMSVDLSCGRGYAYSAFQDMFARHVSNCFIVIILVVFIVSFFSENSLGIIADPWWIWGITLITEVAAPTIILSVLKLYQYCKRVDGMRGCKWWTRWPAYSNVFVWDHNRPDTSEQAYMDYMRDQQSEVTNDLLGEQADTT